MANREELLTLPVRDCLTLAELRGAAADRSALRSAAASLARHLIGLASAPALFVALAPATAPVPVDVIGSPPPGSGSD
jgi:hypothetical protein